MVDPRPVVCFSNRAYRRMGRGPILRLIREQEVKLKPERKDK